MIHAWHWMAIVDMWQRGVYSAHMPLSFTNRVRQAISDCGLSQFELAKRTGIARSTLSRIMSEQRGVTLDLLEKLAPEIGASLTIRTPRRKPIAKGK